MDSGGLHGAVAAEQLLEAAQRAQVDVGQGGEGVQGAGVLQEVGQRDGGGVERVGALLIGALGTLQVDFVHLHAAGTEKMGTA